MRSGAGKPPAADPSLGTAPTEAISLGTAPTEAISLGTAPTEAIAAVPSLATAPTEAMPAVSPGTATAPGNHAASAPREASPAPSERGPVLAAVAVLVVLLAVAAGYLWTHPHLLHHGGRQHPAGHPGATPPQR